MSSNPLVPSSCQKPKWEFWVPSYWHKTGIDYWKTKAGVVPGISCHPHSITWVFCIYGSRCGLGLLFSSSDGSKEKKSQELAFEVQNKALILNTGTSDFSKKAFWVMRDYIFWVSKDQNSELSNRHRKICSLIYENKGEKITQVRKTGNVMHGPCRVLWQDQVQHTVRVKNQTEIKM